MILVYSCSSRKAIQQNCAKLLLCNPFVGGEGSYVKVRIVDNNEFSVSIDLIMWRNEFSQMEWMQADERISDDHDGTISKKWPLPDIIFHKFHKQIVRFRRRNKAKRFWIFKYIYIYTIVYVLSHLDFSLEREHLFPFTNRIGHVVKVCNIQPVCSTNTKKKVFFVDHPEDYCNFSLYLYWKS